MALVEAVDSSPEALPFLPATQAVTLVLTQAARPSSGLLSRRKLTPKFLRP